MIVTPKAMTRNPNARFQFNYIPYPLWRRNAPKYLQPMLNRLYHRIYPVDEDRQPPQTGERMAAYLARYGLLATKDQREILRQLVDVESQVHHEHATKTTPIPYDANSPLRIPAQWEKMESVFINWPILYPPLWELHGQMTESIVPVAQLIVTVPTLMWAQAAWVYLQERGNLTDDQLANITFLIVPTDDIWVRDYGPIIGFDAQGHRVAVDARYVRQKPYGNRDDDNMPVRWAAHSGTPLLTLDLDTEGGNMWSDGEGTLIMSRAILDSNPRFNQTGIARYLRQFFDFEKLIITPYMTIESTGHVDLLVKLATSNTVLVSAPTTMSSAHRLRETATLFRRETNANNQPYRVIELPTPSLYLNWLAYPIRRSYTNALTINGRVLVPVYGLKTDDEALRIYADTLPDYDIIPIDCKIGANGGGAVHCMTKEVPAL